jgi:hypothetical protein
MRAALAGIAFVLLLPACGGGGGDGSASGTTTGPAPELPACAPAIPAGPPPEVPVEFPLPPGTAIVSSASPFPSQIVVLGIVPAELQEAASFFNDTLPDHGYEVGIGDAEGTESEAPFTGNGYRGRWRVNEIPDCRALRLTLVLIEQP